MESIVTKEGVIAPNGGQVAQHPCDFADLPLFSASECRRIIDTASFFEPGLGAVRDADGTFTIRPFVRRATVAPLSERSDTRWVYDRLKTVIWTCNRERWQYTLDSFGPLQLVVYDVGGHYVWHTDVGPGDEARRKLSVTVQLTSARSYVGGGLQFRMSTGVVSATREIGACIVFPSFLLHRVKPVFFGTRVSLVAWACGNAPLR